MGMGMVDGSWGGMLLGVVDGSGRGGGGRWFWLGRGDGGMEGKRGNMVEGRCEDGWERRDVGGMTWEGWVCEFEVQRK